LFSVPVARNVNRTNAGGGEREANGKVIWGVKFLHTFSQLKQVPQFVKQTRRAGDELIVKEAAAGSDMEIGIKVFFS